ncbi:NAD(+) diphosphatase [Stackebrandtia soli]|uniref:NAD(+) diphosphatase n=1 Tax=Stackebrandtia soli TaxID=1892856 RepID=UPI0039E9F9B6
MTLWLARTVLDRAAHRRNDPEWIAKAWKRARVIVVDPTTGHVPVVGDPPRLAFVAADDAPEGERLFLGGEEEPYFAVAGPVPGGAGLREVGAKLSEFEADVLTVAVALSRWHLDHRFSFASGRPTELSAAGWERRDGDTVLWPRTDPAVMVLITDGADRCLLARGVGWPEKRFSCIAGFVEPGESAEAAARREVAEEVGVTIDALDYVASQPWPYPRSLMLAYEAVADPAEPIVPQTDEIAEARWFDRADIADAVAGRPAPLLSSITISISRFLLERWLAEGTGSAHRA